MIPPPFAYFAPTTLHEAFTLLRHYAPRRNPPGGQSLIPLMKLRLATPAYLNDINRIPCRSSPRTPRLLCIGALTREADLERSALVRTHYHCVRYRTGKWSPF